MFSLDFNFRKELTMDTVKVFLTMYLLTTMVLHAEAGLGGLALYGICQSACNVAWVACVAAAGGTAGVTTGGLAVPAAVLACNAGQGLCMAGCAAMVLSPL